MSDKQTSLAEAYYALVRELGYTWQEVLQEKCSRTFFTLEQLEDEAEEMEDEKPDKNEMQSIG